MLTILKLDNTKETEIFNENFPFQATNNILHERKRKKERKKLSNSSFDRLNWMVCIAQFKKRYILIFVCFYHF